jgi:hypothetical protein
MKTRSALKWTIGVVAVLILTAVGAVISLLPYENGTERILPMQTHSLCSSAALIQIVLGPTE